MFKIKVYQYGESLKKSHKPTLRWFFGRLLGFGFFLPTLINIQEEDADEDMEIELVDDEAPFLKGNFSIITKHERYLLCVICGSHF